MQFLRVRDGSCLQAASRVAPSFAPHPLYGQTLPTACAVTEVYLFGTLCVTTGARVVEVLHVVENLSHPSGRDLCFRMREVPDPRICEIHRHGMAVQSRLEGDGGGPSLEPRWKKGVDGGLRFLKRCADSRLGECAKACVSRAIESRQKSPLRSLQEGRRGLF